MVDDDPRMRQTLCGLFETQPEFEVWGEAEHGRHAIDKAEELRPDLITIDFAMPVMNGLDAVPHILNKLPTVLIILLTLYAEEMEARAREVGIHAVVHKNRAATDLIRTAHALFDPTRHLPHGRSARA